MNVTESTPNLIDSLAEEFVQRFRNGERPPISEYEARLPEQAEVIRDLFPALVVMENLKPAAAPVPTTGQVECASEVESLGKLGDYRIVREIGRGGMGIVYEAVQESLGRQVALKVLPKQRTGDSSRHSRFEREARAAARLHHSNIVPVFGVGAENGLHYYAMQYIHGLSLDEVLRELRRLKSPSQDSPVTQECGAPSAEQPQRRAVSATVTQVLLKGLFVSGGLQEPSHDPAETALPHKPAVVGHSLLDTATGRLSDTARLSGSFPLPGLNESGSGVGRLALCQSIARIGAQAGAALHYAHEQGVLHRDIKPSNLLLDTRGTVWVTDFGLAKADDQLDLTNTGDVLGTLRYMAPEMFSSQADRRSDVYSLGLTLYELLALRPAFDESDRRRLIRLVLHESPPRLRTLDPAIPRDLETVIHKAIERDPSHRYASAQDLADDLQRFLNDEPIHARRVSLGTRFSCWCRRNRLLAGLFFTVASMITAAALAAVIAAAHFQVLANRAAASLQTERAAHRQNMQQLFATSVAQARASRLSGRPGQRLDALQAVRTGAALLEPLGLGEDERLALRNEAVGALALVDLKKLRTWEGLSMNTQVALSDDLDWFAYGAADGKSICLRRLGNPQETAGEIPAPVTPNEMSFGFSPDGRRLWACDSAAGTISMFDPASRQPLAGQATDVVDAHAIAMHPHEPYAIVGDRRGVLRKWGLDPLVMTDWISEGAGVLALSFSPDGRKLAVSRNDGGLEIRSLGTGKIEHAWPELGGSRTLAWGSDGAYLAIGKGSEIHFLGVQEAPECAAHFLGHGHQSQVIHLQFHPSQPLLASTAWDGTTRLWDASRGVELLRMVGEFRRFDRDGRRLALRRGRTIELWELALPEAQRWLDQRQLGYIALHPLGRLLAVAYTDGVRLWDVAAQRLVGHLPIGSTEDVLFQPQSGHLLTAGQAGVWQWPVDVKAIQEGRVRIGPPTAIHADLKPTRKLHSSDDGQVLLAEGKNYREATVVDRRGEAPVLRGLSAPGLACAALSPDGRWAASGDFAGARTVTIWDTRSGASVHQLPCTGVGPLRFSPDGRSLVGNTGAAVLYWSVDPWQLVHEVPIETNGGSAIGFGPDSRIMATGQWGSGMRLFEVQSARPIVDFEIPESPPAYVGLVFTPDGGQLIGAADVEGLCVWDVRTIRRHLVDLGLDWNQPPIPAAAGSATTLTFQMDLGALAPKESPKDSKGSEHGER